MSNSLNDCVVKMTRISASVLLTPYSKLYILTKLSANDVKFISSDRQELDLSIYIYSCGTVNSIFVEIQPDSTNIKMTLVSTEHIKLIFGMKSLIIQHKKPFL